MTEGLYANSPSGFHLRRDLEFAALKREQKSRAARSSKCPVCVLAAIVILSIILLIFALTVLRIRSLDVKLTSVTFKNLRYGVQKSPSFNATMVLEMTIKNMNFGQFEFENGLAYVKHRGVTVGKKNIGHGFVDARETMKLNLTVDVRSHNKPSDTDLSSDIGSGMLELSSYAKFRGTLRSVKIIEKIKSAELNCTMTLNLASGTSKDLRCK
ncbi:late embryogenesis abundant protein At1g64065-like [Juglans microcarpa x Juglans regia]|uniref:late embryogenesis abundant protein At1g64065-like n=1 Tax=Juglans microcarpa x Juglans regia TaxID=2249226 RepID=UPI001B7E268F|nr:late embryogenesis abundant protein At1g64065-like [Juglans microcarpa x Juglans regia]